jgi:hypothetical protein
VVFCVNMCIIVHQSMCSCAFVCKILDVRVIECLSVTKYVCNCEFGFAYVIVYASVRSNARARVCVCVCVCVCVRA